MECPACGTEMDATPSTVEYPNCNTWTCSACGMVGPELGSLVEPECVCDKQTVARRIFDLANKKSGERKYHEATILHQAAGIVGDWS